MIVLLLSTLALGQEAFDGVGAPPLGDVPTSEAELEARTDHLAGILRCPVCQGMTVADSQEDSSLAMKARIREMVAAGYTEQQVVDYFVDRYGEGILLLPDERHWLVWIGPLLMLLVGTGLVAVKMRGGSAPKAPRPSAVAEGGTDRYRDAILEELGD